MSKSSEDLLEMVCMQGGERVGAFRPFSSTYDDGIADYERR